jgi:hypothetical protein
MVISLLLLLSVFLSSSVPEELVFGGIAGGSVIANASARTRRAVNFSQESC